MKHIGSCYVVALSVVTALALSSCSSSMKSTDEGSYRAPVATNVNVDGRLPQHIQTSEKTVIVDPRQHAWGAYDKDGNLLKSGLATSGSSYCPDLKRGCQTAVGSYRIQSLGDVACKSKSFPLPRGGAPMPYCMFFHNGMALHGSPSPEVQDRNISHGCVRMHVADAEWLRFNFADVGTKVVVKPY